MGASMEIRDEVTPVLNRMRATVADRRAIAEQIGREVMNLCKEYVANDAPNRHATAQKLGANPTGFLGSAIDAIHYTATDAAVIIDFSSPWFASVGHDVHIAPGPGKKFLAIPIATSAYGVRLQGNFNGGKFFKGPNGGLFYGMPYPGNEKVLQPLYILVPFVDQKQDRTRLPSDDEIMESIRLALREAVEQRIAAVNSMNN